MPGNDEVEDEDEGLSDNGGARRDRGPGKDGGAACPDCGALVRESHRAGCDVERCTVCGAQRPQCRCAGHDPQSARWEGEWPGAARCRARGWWCALTPQGWRPCSAGAAGATEDLNRLAFFDGEGRDALYGPD